MKETYTSLMEAQSALSPEVFKIAQELEGMKGAINGQYIVYFDPQGMITKGEKRIWQKLGLKKS